MSIYEIPHKSESYGKAYKTRIYEKPYGSPVGYNVIERPHSAFRPERKCGGHAAQSKG